MASNTTDASGRVERLTMDDTIRFMETAFRNWEHFEISHDDADDIRVAIEAFRKQSITNLSARVVEQDAEIARLHDIIATHIRHDVEHYKLTSRLVIAARNVAYGDVGDHAAVQELDAAAEAFAAIVPWEDEPALEAKP